MRLNISSKQALFGAIIAGLALSLVFGFYFFSKNTLQNKVMSLDAVVVSSQDQTTVALPMRLKIPSIDVDASVEYVGLTPTGAMGIPKGPDEVAWFNLGPRPGEVGSAAIAGHWGWGNNTPAVFDNLHTVRVGDMLSVEDEKGVITVFVVREARIYDKDAVAPDVFTSNDGKAHLNLITCTGDWNEVEETFSERLVIFTDRK